MSSWIKRTALAAVATVALMGAASAQVTPSNPPWGWLWVGDNPAETWGGQTVPFDDTKIFGNWSLFPDTTPPLLFAVIGSFGCYLYGRYGRRLLGGDAT